MIRPVHSSRHRSLIAGWAVKPSFSCPPQHLADPSQVTARLRNSLCWLMADVVRLIYKQAERNAPRLANRLIS